MTLPRYKIRILPQARMEINSLYKHIYYDRFSPMAARRYRHGIYQTIYGLSLTGGMFAVNDNNSLQRQYGSTVRTIIYKKMTIIYTVSEGLVVVHSVKPGGTIK